MAMTQSEVSAMVPATQDGAQRSATKYRVTRPECGSTSITEWTDILPPGGVSPVQCSACGYMILSESEGNPVEIAEHAPPWARGYVHVYTGTVSSREVRDVRLAGDPAGRRCLPSISPRS
jgi:hypothetical protein